MAFDRIVEAHPAVGDQLEYDGRDERLGDAADPEPAVGTSGTTVAPAMATAASRSPRRRREVVVVMVIPSPGARLPGPWDHVRIHASPIASPSGRGRPYTPRRVSAGRPAGVDATGGMNQIT
ncbi:hypothetical protein [Kitasatospora sp. NPDC088351]|uniref:hypothetical protein n=1 Tax=Kitasatospora sp. NPDC088351 TaxID=3155180 RepID=UPI00341C90B6